MNLGEKLFKARQEAGLSQRQLCGDVITRNMLSQIEHGTAKPSMETLRYLSQRLGKPMSYFLEEDVVASANQAVMASARAAFDRGDQEALWQALEAFREPDDLYGREYQLLKILCLLARGEAAAAQRREPYAASLLEQAGEAIAQAPYGLPELERRRVLLLGRLRSVKPATVEAQLPAMDEELLLRARSAIAKGQLSRAAALLDAAEDQSDADWGLLRGEVYLKNGDYAASARCYHLAEERYPRQTARPLEQCYRELGDFRLAYNYACRERSFSVVNEG